VGILSGRIEAMARAHSLLSQSRWEGAPLRALLGLEMERYRQTRADAFSLVGEDVMLQPKAAQSLAVALHELATNAARYGALSTERGRVDIAWRLVSNRGAAALRVEWRERGGPAVAPPRSEGFGTLVLRRMLVHDLGATVDLEYAPAGLVCRIALPGRQIVGLGVLAAPRASPRPRQKPELSGGGPRGRDPRLGRQGPLSRDGSRPEAPGRGSP
jgi:two-component sensor histidine kinase